MKQKKKIYAADLFCGAGGTSSGFINACAELGLEVELVAVNHWETAIATHSLNHPGVIHYDCDLETLDPLDAVKGGYLDVLLASPECTHFSNARGAKPMNEQSRASANYITYWCERLDIRELVIENVREFMTWGPLHRCTCSTTTDVHSSKCQKDRPNKAKQGLYFRKFIRDLEKLGYTVQYRVLCCADYGDATTRKRLFIRASKNGNPTFPEATHSKQPDLFIKERWRAVREVLDLNNLGKSIFNRKKPLSPNTLRRLETGLLRYSGISMVLGQQSGAEARPIDEPAPTVAGAGAIGLAQAFIVPQFSGAPAIPVDQPLGTVTTTSRGIGVAQPFLIPCFGDAPGQSRTHSIDAPLPTQTGSNTFALAQPYIIPQSPNETPSSVDEPLGEINEHSRRIGLAQPFIVSTDNSNANGAQVRSTEEPLQTITTRPAFGVAQPFIVQADMGGSVQSVDEPMNVITSADARGIVQAFLIEYYGTGESYSVDAPLKTQTGKDRFGLVQPRFVHNGKEYVLEIFYRMLTPRELAGAMSFNPDYQFAGTREEVVKQIGNAVPGATAKALSREAILEALSYRKSLAI